MIARDGFQATEAELRNATGRLDEAHRDVLAEFQSGIRSVRENLADGGFTRRSFLGGAAALGGGALLAGCGTPVLVAGQTTYTSGDLQAVQLFASLEKLALTVYSTLSDRASTGHLGKVPAAVNQFGTTVMSQHTLHMSAWNSALQSAGKPFVTSGDPALAQSMSASASAASSLTAAAQLAMDLEMTLAATYTRVLASMASMPLRATALSVAPVEVQHATVLQLLLAGTLNVGPATLATTTARSVSDVAG